MPVRTLIHSFYPMFCTVDPRSVHNGDSKKKKRDVCFSCPKENDYLRGEKAVNRRESNTAQDTFGAGRSRRDHIDHPPIPFFLFPFLFDVVDSVSSGGEEEFSASSCVFSQLAYPLLK